MMDIVSLKHIILSLSLSPSLWPDMIRTLATSPQNVRVACQLMNWREREHSSHGNANRHDTWVLSVLKRMKSHHHGVSDNMTIGGKDDVISKKRSFWELLDWLLVWLITKREKRKTWENSTIKKKVSESREGREKWCPLRSSYSVTNDFSHFFLHKSYENSITFLHSRREELFSCKFRGSHEEI